MPPAQQNDQVDVWVVYPIFQRYPFFRCATVFWGGSTSCWQRTMGRCLITTQYLSGAAVCFEPESVAMVEGCGSQRRRLNFAQSPLEKPTLAVIGNQREGACVALRRFHCGPDAAEQISARSMQ